MKQHRIDSPQQLDESDIASRIASSTKVIVQYSKPGYQPQQLIQLNELAKRHGRALEVRFYSHNSTGFDASTLRFLPDVQSLSIDCLMSARNLDAISELHDLRMLNLGVFDLDNSQILSTCCLLNLEALTLGDTRKCRIDLAPLAACVRLHRFHTTGHTRNITAICSLPELQSLSLSSIKASDEVDFVSDLVHLKTLRFILGGRASIANLNNPGLVDLEIIRVRGLQDIGDIGRFHRLESLHVEDQIRLEEIKLGKNPELRRIRVINCKTLKDISGLTGLNVIADLGISRTAIDFQALVANGLPLRLQTFSFGTGLRKRDAEISADLADRGYERFIWH